MPKPAGLLYSVPYFLAFFLEVFCNLAHYIVGVSGSGNLDENNVRNPIKGKLVTADYCALTDCPSPACGE
jgi:hypothetical protein